MMATTIKKCLTVALVALVPVTVFSQDDTAAMAEAIAQLEQMSAEVNEFVGDVRFDEGDVTSLLDLWDEFSGFESDDDEDDEGATIDFDAILGDSEYRRWAASHNLDADDWLRKTTRISMALYREYMLAAADMMPEQMQQQLAMIEQQREALGEEMYQQVMQGMQATMAYSEAVTETARRLPESTAAEQALLDKYREELTGIMELGDEEDEYDEYGEYEEYDEYEDDEF